MNIVHNKYELHLSNLGIKYTGTFMSLQFMYRKVSNIRRTKSQNLNASRLILQLSLPTPLKPGVKLRMKM